MPDDTKQRGGQDRTRIDVSEDYELRDWAKKQEAGLQSYIRPVAQT